MLRILILAASTGGGHIKASRAIESNIRQNMEDAEVQIVDVLKCINMLLDKTVCDGYRFWQKYAENVRKNLSENERRRKAFQCGAEA